MNLASKLLVGGSAVLLSYFNPEMAEAQLKFTPVDTSKYFTVFISDFTKEVERFEITDTDNRD